MSPLVDKIAFHKIGVFELIHLVRPLHVVPENRILTALAYWADPTAVKESELTQPLHRSSPVQSNRRKFGSTSSTPDAL